MQHYTPEEFQQKLRVSMPSLLFRAIHALVAARLLVYGYCFLPALKPIVVGLALIWLLLAALTALSAYGNTVQGKPAIGAGEARFLTILALIAIALIVGCGLEIMRGMKCSI